MNFVTILGQLPEGVGETSELVGALDECFLVGFANLDGEHEETLASLQRVFGGTPLGQALADSCAAMQRNEFVASHFMVIAAARAALQGAQFDSLQQQVRSALGRAPLVEMNRPEIAAPKAPSHVAVWLDSTRQWLMELALGGFGRLDAGMLTPFMATLEQIQGEPQLVRQSALLTGFFYELMRAVPIADASQVPTFRWVDLWTRAMISQPTPARTPKSVSGTLRLLGVDLRQHAHLVSFVAYGLLENQAQGTQLVRVTMSSYKVEAIRGQETWLLFPKAAPLLDALAEARSLQIRNMPLLPTGDLIWQGKATVGQKYDLMSSASQWVAPQDQAQNQKRLTPTALSPTDRHPVQLAEPVFLSNYTIKKVKGSLSLTWGKLSLPIATERISSLSELTPDALSKSTQLFGLLRFDAGQWSLQPLSTRKARGKTKLILSGGSASAILKKPPRTNTVAILQERASRLLRA